MILIRVLLKESVQEIAFKGLTQLSLFCVGISVANKTTELITIIFFSMRSLYHRNTHKKYAEKDALKEKQFFYRMLS
tara:strand:+ start:2083 stop:2313 length:231 start_codon:yes stop_codon:yes gene_type:complete